METKYAKSVDDLKTLQTTDSDIDGIVNETDLCTSDKFFELVDENGCTDEQLVLLAQAQSTNAAESERMKSRIQMKIVSKTQMKAVSKTKAVLKTMAVLKMMA